MSERDYYIKATLVRELWHQTHRVGRLQELLEEAIAEKERLQRHLYQVEQEREQEDRC